MNPLYNLGIAAYETALRIASKHNEKVARMLTGRSSALDTLRSEIGLSDRPVWIHAASLGEFEQGRPLIEALKKRRPETKIVLSFYSPSGYDVRKHYPMADAVVYLPSDRKKDVEAFLDAMHPSMAVIVKYEFWGNLLQCLRRRAIPVYLICACFRPGQVFFKPYGGTFRSLLKCFTHIFVQDEGSRALLQDVGCRNVTVAGDTRFDRVDDIRRQRREIPEALRFTRRVKETGGLVMVAGSSWPQDEDKYASWVNGRRDLRLILAPHEFDTDRLSSLKSLFDSAGAVLLSEAQENPELLDNARVLVVDCFGLLSSLYAYGDIAYVGGGFGAGLHNINEAAVYAIPVVYGPNNSKFIEARELRTPAAEGSAPGGYQVADRRECEETLDRLASDRLLREASGKRAGEYIQSRLGATKRILTLLDPD